MALYDYRCKTCLHIQTVNHPIDHRPHVNCESCGKECSRMYSAPAVSFKGGGWGKDAR